MNHFTLPRFWQHYNSLPENVRQLADKNYQLLRDNPFHPSLHFKKVGNKNHLWSVHIGIHYRALGLDKSEGVIWFWIGTHAEYNKLIG
jgi:hypothetical protein